jgi:hypothetical protein
MNDQQKATARQLQYLSGAPGSPKKLAHELRTTLAGFGKWPTRFSEKVEADMDECTRQDMIKELASCDSEFFRQVQRIGTALDPK